MRVFLPSNSVTVSSKSKSAFSGDLASSLSSYPANHHGYFFLSPSKLGSSASSPSGSHPVSLSSIFPTQRATSSITLSIQLNRETASWNKVPQKAVSTHTLQPLYLTIIVTLKKIITISHRLPHTISKRDRKNTRGPTTEYWGKKLIPTRSMRDSCAWAPNARPHSPFSSVLCRPAQQSPPGRPFGFLDCPERLQIRLTVSWFKCFCLDRCHSCPWVLPSLCPRIAWLDRGIPLARGSYNTICHLPFIWGVQCLYSARGIQHSWLHN